MQPDVQLRGHDQQLDGTYSPTTTSTKTGLDLYYSNHEISILHSIVATAQRELDLSVDPKPLPAAVLFKAYDNILPTFGIDPDSDHHLSAFIFRVGGEQGHGALYEKFQAILGRMGIVLEFGDDTVASIQTSPSSSPSVPKSSVAREISIAERRFTVAYPLEDLVSSDSASVAVVGEHNPPFAEKIAPHGTLSATLQPSDAGHALDDDVVESLVQEQSRSSDAGHGIHQADGTDDGAVDGQAEENPSPQAYAELKPNFAYGTSQDAEKPTFELRQATLSSAFDLWRQQARHTIPPVLHNHMINIAGERSDDLGEAGKIKSMHHSLLNLSGSLAQDASRSSAVAQDVDLVLTQLSTNGTPSAHPNSAGSMTEKASMSAQNCQAAVTPARRESLSTTARAIDIMRRASRARQIYLGSKFFNRWASKTATRLEREAVARRHMVRFRCFRGWSQAPSSRIPAADNLRAATAVQKLRRAVLFQEEQLNLATAAIAEVYREKMAQRAMTLWICQCNELGHLRRYSKRRRLTTVGHWLQYVDQKAKIRSTALSFPARYRRIELVYQWCSRADQASRRLATAERVGNARNFVLSLREWLDQLELKRQSECFRQNMLTVQGLEILDLWTSRSMAQALRWHFEYRSATCTLDSWLHRSSKHYQARHAARQRHKRIARVKAVRQIESMACTELTRMHSQARLYISYMMLLGVLGTAVQQRKARMRGSIRRYLMVKYTQASSTRKKRNFLVALDRWKLSTTEALDSSGMTRAVVSRRTSAQRSAVLDAWCTQTGAELQMTDAAQRWHRGLWLELWVEIASGQGQQHDQAWSSWASEQKRYCLKFWSRTALQRSGQAHTAVMVQHRHIRETRVGVLQRWKASSSAEMRDKLDQSPITIRKMQSHSLGNRSGGRADLSGKRVGQVISGMETPTRWTGHPVSMVNSVSSLLASRGAGRRVPNVISSVAAQNFEASQPRRERPNYTASAEPTSPSTTPLVPVPTQLARKPRDSNGGRFSRSLDTGLYGTRQSRPVNHRYVPPATPGVLSNRRLNGNPMQMVPKHYGASTGHSAELQHTGLRPSALRHISSTLTVADSPSRGQDQVPQYIE